MTGVRSFEFVTKVGYNFRDKDPRIADIFVKKGAFLKMYTLYIKDFKSMTQSLDQAIREYPAFAEKLREFEVRLIDNIIYLAR